MSSEVMERSGSISLLLALLANIALCIYFAASVDVDHIPPEPLEDCGYFGSWDCREPITG